MSGQRCDGNCAHSGLKHVASRRRLATGLVLLAAVTASAQSRTPLPPFSLTRFALDPTMQSAMALGSADLPKVGTLRLLLGAGYEYAPLSLREAGLAPSVIIFDRVPVHLSLAFVAHKRLQLAVGLPAVIYQRSNQQALDVNGFEVPAERGLGMPWVSAKVALIHRAAEERFGLSLEAKVGVPTGQYKALVQDTSVYVRPRLLASLLALNVLWSAELSATLRPSSVKLGNQTVSHQLRAGAAARLKVWEHVEPELGATADVDASSGRATVEGWFGTRWQVAKPVGVFALLGSGFGPVPGSPMVRVMAGVDFSFELMADEPLPVVAVVDRCAGVHRPEECPALDDDSDGVRNGDDRCPLVAGVPEEAGCPARPPDGDGDGVIDANDRCPNLAGVEARQGCPENDGDGDGVLDANDACLEEAGSAEARGCPVRDGDGDQVSDHLDNCPAEAGPAANHGCPERQKQLVVITRQKLLILEKVQFETAKAKVLKKSYRLLEQIASVIKSHPTLGVVSIEGHTDSRGNAQFNFRLSEQRARAVLEYLVKRGGVDLARLTSQGFGAANPADTNETAQGREKNRRVEFRILQAEPVAPAPSPQ